MAAPATTAQSVPPSTSPAPASAGAQYPTPSSLPLEPSSFPPPPTYPTFVHNGVPYVYIPIPVAFLPGAPSHVTAARKRKRPTMPPPCTLCRLSRTSCVATRPGEACQRCILKEVDCFDDGDTTESSRLRHPPTDDGPDDADSEPERDPNQSSIWQLPTNGYSPQAPPYLSAAATPGKRERVIKACADCHARKRKCTGIGGPNCGTANPRVPPAPNGVPPGPVRPSPRKGTPGGASGHTRMREPCADCRGRKRRCIHHGDDKDATDMDVGDESMRTDHESDLPRSRSSHTPPRWAPHPPNPYYSAPPPPPPPQFGGYPHNDHRMPYPPHAGGPGQLVHPHEHAYGPPPHPPPHNLHPHHRLPPAPDMRHHPGAPPSCKECRARGVQCTCPETRADDGSSPNSTAPIPPAIPVKGATPAPAPPAGRKGRACLACRKLKMRCVAPNNGNDNVNSNPDGPDERCQRCERAGLECIYVDRKRRGPGAVFGVQVDGATAPASFDGFGPQSNQNGTPNGNGNGNGVPAAPNSPSQRPPTKKLKREGSPRTSSPYPGAPGGMMQVEESRTQRVMGEDVARALEEFADDDEEDGHSR